MNKLKLAVAASALVLAACGEAAKTVGGDQPLQPIEEFSIQFPRDFSGGVEYRKHRADTRDPIDAIETSNYTPFAQESVLGCMTTNGGSDFTVVMRNANQDQLRIRISRLYLRESQSEYKNLPYVALDGYSPSRNIMLNSSVQPQVTSPACSAKLWLTNTPGGSQLSGDISCPTVNTIGSAQQVEVYVKISSCQVINR